MEPLALRARSADETFVALRSRPSVQHHRWVMHCIAALAFAAVTSAVASVHATAARVTAFGVKEYNDCCPGGGDECDMPNAVTGASDFFDDIIADSNGLWLAGVERYNNNVRGRAMGDPEWSGVAANIDSDATNGWDYWAGITYFQGHGVGNPNAPFRDGADPDFPILPCTAHNQCPAAPAGLDTPAVCVRWPTRTPCPAGESCAFPTAASFCSYQYSHALSVCRTGDTGGVNRVDFSQTGVGLAPKEMRLGEFQTGWAEAGANGGAQLAVIFSSHTMHMGSPGMNVQGMFGGLDMLYATYTHWGDHADVANRGPILAQEIASHPNTPVAQIMGIAAAMVTDGGGCRGFKHDGTPHEGFNGCGGHVVMVMDSTSARVQAAVQRTPTQLQDITLFPAGNNFRNMFFTSNWDDVSFPIIVGSKFF